MGNKPLMMTPEGPTDVKKPVKPRAPRISNPVSKPTKPVKPTLFKTKAEKISKPGFAPKVDMSNVKKVKPRPVVNSENSYGDVFNQVFGDQLGKRMANRLKIRPFISGAQKIGEAIRTGEAVNQYKNVALPEYQNKVNAYNKNEVLKKQIPQNKKMNAAMMSVYKPQKKEFDANLKKYNAQQAKIDAYKKKIANYNDEMEEYNNFMRGFKKGVKK